MAPELDRHQLREFRLTLGLTQEEFGAELGYKHPQVIVSLFENGRRRIGPRLSRAVWEWQEKLGMIAELQRAKNGIKRMRVA